MGKEAMCRLTSSLIPLCSKVGIQTRESSVIQMKNCFHGDLDVEASSLAWPWKKTGRWGALGSRNVLLSIVLVLWSGQWCLCLFLSENDVLLVGSKDGMLKFVPSALLLTDFVSYQV